MTENPRIEELRRRVQSDPTSIAFAALAEEYRRAGRYEEAIDVCRSGLTRHPAYISARVTLGRALLEINKIDEAAAELEQVLKIAPENLAATRALTEIAARRAAEPDVAPTPVRAAEPKGGFEQDLMAGLARVGLSQEAAAPVPTPLSTGTHAPHPEPLEPAATVGPGARVTMVARLQQFLNGVLTVKAERTHRAGR